MLLSEVFQPGKGAIVRLFLLVQLLLLSSCDLQPWNNPYPEEDSTAKILYSAFTEPVKTLDPGRSYSSNEYIFTTQIYEPPLQYHYLKRPYVLDPLLATEIPVAVYYDNNGQELAQKAPARDVAQTRYRIQIKPGVYYQPHPAFARHAAGGPLYHHLSENELSRYKTFEDFVQKGTRELKAEDFIYQIKRLAQPSVQSPLYGLMSEHILGLSELHQQLKAVDQTKQFVDLREYPLAGVRLVDDYTFDVILYGKDPQFVYWFTTPFFSPIPVEADQFYSQPGMAEKHIGFTWQPVGTGAFMLEKHDPNLHMILARNPNFRGEAYPSEGEPGDLEKGLLDPAGQTMPFIDKAIFSLEKESIPYWNKFLQGYYDMSGISSSSFNQVIQFGSDNNPKLAKEFDEKGIQLHTTVPPTIYYYGFNMVDPVVGGYSEQARKLRQAISLTIDFQEYINIFLQNRAVLAHSPIPPGVPGFQDVPEGINPIVYDWKDNRAKLKSIEQARQLLAEAGYPNGVDPKTNQPLVIQYLSTAIGPEAQSQLLWMQRQFKKLGIQLDILQTTYNRYLDLIRQGQAQFYGSAWHADYPDPENFLFLLYGPQSKMLSGGENTTNYQSEEFDRLYEELDDLDNPQERHGLVQKMIALVRVDAPWIFGLFDKQYILVHQWVSPIKPHELAQNILKYRQINPQLRAMKRKEWNQPILWPLGVFVLVALILVVPVVVAYRKRRKAPVELPQ